MRFFSNDARESSNDRASEAPAGDDPADNDQTPETRAAETRAPETHVPDARDADTRDADTRDADTRDGDTRDGDEQPDRVQSAPVPVPHQRPSSPWSNTPPAADDPAEAGADRRDGVLDPGADGVPGRDGKAPSPFPEPSAQPTAFGSTVASNDGAVASSTNTYAGNTAPVSDTVPATWTQRDTHDPDDLVDVPLDDTGATSAGVSGRSGAATPAPGSDTDRDVDRDDATESGALEDDGDFDDPKAVEPATGTPLETRDADDAPDAGAPPAVAVPVAAATPAPAARSDTLFDPQEARTFQDRWRDVQLHFVDSPKDATGDAAKLVDEAVEKLSASLRSQRDGFTDDTDDTEKLRVQLRGYREILNRILTL